MAATTYLALVKAEYDYAATAEEEISISEDQVLYVLEYTDDDWWKVRVKISPTEGLSPEEAPTGLVPSTYVTPLQPIKQATALYDYEATSEEEITIKEDVVYDLFEEDGDWTLVGARDKKEVGYAPTAYLEIGGEAATNGHSEEANIPAPPPAPPLPTAAATATNTPRKTNGVTSDKVLTWSGVTELEGKKKKKGTLGIGNGALFFASDSDKAPVQKKDLSILKDITTEKGKQIKLYFTNGELLQFTVSKDDMEAISSKIESSREFAQNGGASQGAQEQEEEEEDNYVPPPPPPPPTSSGAKAFGFLPPPPRRMVSSDSEDSDDDDDEPPRRSGAGNGSAAIPAAPPPPPAPPAPPVAVPQAPRAPTIPIAPPAPSAATTAASASAGGGRRAKAEYDFTASEPEELSLTEGETLYVLDDSAEDWWKVRNERGEEGEVPASYVELLEDHTSAGGPSAVNEDADEEAARRLQEEERAEARREKERLRLKKLEEEARGIGSFDFKPPPSRKATASSSAETAAAARAVAATRAPSPPPPPPAPPAMSSPPPSAPVRQESKDSHDAVREQRRERHRQRELQREREKAQAQSQQPQSPVLPVEKTKPSPSRVRTWIDRTGAFKVDAEFVGLSGTKNEKIRLHKLNGVVIEVPLDKMSAEDIRLVEHMVRKKLASSSSSSSAAPGGGDRHRSERHRNDRPREADQQSQSQQHRARPPSSTTASRRAPTSSTGGRKDQTDWFEWFLNAGCDIDDCERYARNFEKDRIDVDIVGDLEVGTLRSLGLREGDIIRVRKFIAKKTGGASGASASAGGAGTSRGPPPPDKDPSSDREHQLHEDEELARKLQEEMNAGRDGSGLFTSSSGGVKNTRRGRPQPKSAPSAASFDSIASSLTASGGIDRTATPGSERVVSPDTTKESSSRRARADSNLISSSSGFDDDAWTVKPSPSNAKSASPVLIDTGSSSSSARATPSPAPQAANAGRDLAGLRNQTASPAMPTSSKEASSAQALTDAYLDSIGLGKRSVTEYGSGHPGRQNASPAPPAPAPPQQQQQQPQQPQQTGYAQQNQMSPQQTGYYQQQQPANGPRQPPAPIPLNQQLLNPLIPTQTGMTGFIPTRNQQSPMPMMPQHTSFQQPQQTSFQPQQPMQTGFPGQSPFGNQFAVQQQPQQPMMQQPQYGGMMQSQPTGYPISQMSHLSMQPTGMPYQATPSPQPQMQMHIPQAPPPPPMPVQPQQTQQAPSSSQASDFQPASVFAKMKAGQFAKPDSSAQPQQKYDALRPQPTSFGGMQHQPQQMQPQPTGFPNQMQPLQAQPTGFAPGGYISMPQQQPNMMYPQQTGYPYRPY